MLFVPMFGRIYASEHFPYILHDTKALELKGKLPKNIKGQNTQTQYTLLAGAVRSSNMDRYITNFVNQNPDGVVAELGCGLETAFYRNDNGKTLWYEIDLPNVIEYRKNLLGLLERDKTLSADAFDESWIRHIRAEHPTAPLLITASGLFYYFEKNKVLELFKNLKKYGNIEIVFDTVNSNGMKRIHKYMKQVGHADAKMYFYVDSGINMVNEIGVKLLAEEPYYIHTKKRGLNFISSCTMKISDCFSMVKMIHIRLND